jgi:hypothetical protein
MVMPDSGFLIHSFIVSLNGSNNFSFVIHHVVIISGETFHFSHWIFSLKD